MTQCPDHPGRMGATLGNCTHCDREAAHADHAAAVTRVRAALAVAARPPIAAEPVNPTHDLARARAALDRKDRR